MKQTDATARNDFGGDSHQTLRSSDSDLYKAALDWDADRREADRLSLKRYKAIAITGFGSAVLMGVSLVALLPLKEFVPTVIRVDNATGAYDVKTAGANLDVGDSRNEKIIISDVTRYIKAREGFSRGEAEESYRTAYLLSCGAQRTEWDNYFNPELNKNSPVALLSNQDADRVTVQSVTFLTPLDENSKTAQVQFEKTVMRGSNSPLRYRYVATMNLRYDERNIPNNQQNYYLNPFGLCIESYRRDPVGNPTVVNAAGTPNQEFNQVMEHLRQQTDAALEAVRAQQALNAQRAAEAAMAASAAQPAAGPASSPPLVDLTNIGMSPGAVPATPATQVQTPAASR